MTRRGPRQHPLAATKLLPSFCAAVVELRGMPEWICICETCGAPVGMPCAQSDRPRRLLKGPWLVQHHLDTSMPSWLKTVTMTPTTATGGVPHRERVWFTDHRGADQHGTLENAWTECLRAAATGIVAVQGHSKHCFPVPLRYARHVQAWCENPSTVSEPRSHDIRMRRAGVVRHDPEEVRARVAALCAAIEGNHGVDRARGSP